MSDLLKLADLAATKPPFFSACHWGFHRTVEIERLITCGQSVCIRCGQLFATSIFGDFEYGRQESANRLRSLSTQEDKT